MQLIILIMNERVGTDFGWWQYYYLHYKHIFAYFVATIHFYVYGYVHRWSILITVQRDATQSSLFIIPQVHSTCFGCKLHPSSGIHKTVTTASGTGHIFCAAPSLQRCVASRWTVINI